MHTDLENKLKVLENEYFDQPSICQKADLIMINDFRAQLKMPQVDARLRIIGGDVEKSDSSPLEPKDARKGTTDARIVNDHREARTIYDTYLAKLEELKPHREHARQVVAATGRGSTTPVRPLATMGSDGGPLLCDHCKLPMVLEGGRYNGVPVNVAWRLQQEREAAPHTEIGNQDDGSEWQSFILGGMVVDIQTNETLRIYHGYLGERFAKYCVDKATEAQKKEEDAFKRSTDFPKKVAMLRDFIESEFQQLTIEERQSLVNEIVTTLFCYDPGIGINRPSKCDPPNRE